jgi:hypothetical protein
VRPRIFSVVRGYPTNRTTKAARRGRYNAAVAAIKAAEQLEDGAGRRRTATSARLRDPDHQLASFMRSTIIDAHPVSHECTPADEGE